MFHMDSFLSFYSIKPMFFVLIQSKSKKKHLVKYPKESEEFIMFDATEAINNIIDDINADYYESCYDAIYEELCERVEDGNMTIEEAEMVNEAAAEKYLYEKSKNVDKALEEDDDDDKKKKESDKNIKKKINKKKVAVGVGLAAAGAGALAYRNKKCKNNKCMKNKNNRRLQELHDINMINQINQQEMERIQREQNRIFDQQHQMAVQQHINMMNNMF